MWKALVTTRLRGNAVDNGDDVGAGKQKMAAAATKMFTGGDVLAMAEGAGATGIQEGGRLAGTMKIEASEGTVGTISLTHTSSTEEQMTTETEHHNRVHTRRWLVREAAQGS